MKRIIGLLLLMLAPIVATAQSGPPSWGSVLAQQQGVEEQPLAEQQTNVDVGIDMRSENQAQATNETTVSTTVNGGGFQINEGRHSASSAYGPSVYPNPGCQGSASGGFQNRILGFSYGMTYTDLESCLMALAQNCAAFGLWECTCRALMATKSSDRAFGYDKKPKKKKKKNTDNFDTFDNGIKKPDCSDFKGPAPAPAPVAPPPQIVMMQPPPAPVVDQNDFVTKEEFNRALNNFFRSTQQKNK